MERQLDILRHRFGPGQFLGCRTVQVAVTLFVCAICIFYRSTNALAAWQEGFESPNISWAEAKADVAHRVVDHRRVTGSPHGGKVAEYIKIEAADGTYVYFSHDIPPARIIAELVPSIWVNADRPGIRLAARLVLPHTIDTRTGQPLTAIVHGTERESTYSQTGRWQQLRITDLPLQLNRKLVVLRAEHGSQVDVREAYIDQVWLNAYGGRDVTSTLIDDLEVAGLVPRMPSAQSSGPTEAANITTKSPTGDTNAVGQIALRGTVLYVDGRPFFPRIIQSQGEPLTWLKELGFNAVRIPSPPTPELLDEARQTGMWLIAPPPQDIWQNTDEPSGGPGMSGLPVRRAPRAASQNPLVNSHGQNASYGQAAIARDAQEIGPQYDRVLAWHLGSGLAAQDVPRVAAMAKQLATADRSMNRPIVCDAEEELFNYTSHVPILSVHRFPLGSDLELFDYGSWLKERPRLARPGKPLWTVIQTEPSPTIVAQVKSLGGPGTPHPTIDADALRLLTYQVFSAGVRAVEFASSSRLDAADNATRIRGFSLALLNLELELLEPWGAAGSTPTPISSRDPNLRGVMIGADGTKMVVAMRCPKGSQYVPQPAPMQAAGASFTVAGVPESHAVYEVTLAGVREIRRERIVGGTSVLIEDFPLTALAMITSDPIAVKSMTERVKALTPRAVVLQRELAMAMLADTEQVQSRMAANSQLPPAAVTFNAARTALAASDQWRAAKNWENAYFAARNAAVAPARWRREVWNRATSELSSPIASPLATCFATLPDQLNFAALLASAVGGENLLVGGEFEDLQVMLTAGWRNFEHPQPQLTTSVELSPLAPSSGRFCLRLQALPEKADAPPALVESPPLWVTSAPVQLEAGDVVCIRGQARVPTKISGSVDGLMIIDSLGGDALAERIDDTKEWREFVLYRAATQHGPLAVTFALTGIGEAAIDNVSIRLIRHGNGRPVERSPIEPALAPGIAPRPF
ncbi:MAG: hypothetical protein IT427_13145 [Pirellulales bacterium]|nr:hypothetical protein [Pirellulales bacterium]